MTETSLRAFQDHVRRGIPGELPAHPAVDPTVSRAPARPLLLSDAEKRLALQNALRYFPAHLHADLAPEFAAELREHGRIYMHRFRPPYAMQARPIDHYPARCRQAAAIMLIDSGNPKWPTTEPFSTPSSKSSFVRLTPWVLSTLKP